MSSKFTSPFASSSSKPGHGKIHVSILPPSTPVLSTLSYQYPLKLVAPDPLPPPHHDLHPDKSPSAIRNGTLKSDEVEPQKPSRPPLVHTIFLLTYGGGIVAGDTLSLSIILEAGTRLILLTQGSTKIFKTPDAALISRQRMEVDLKPGSALCYLPDPVQPFRESAFAQGQIYNLLAGEGEGEEAASLCVCDWVTSGRSARGENWDIHSYASRNEVWSLPPSPSPSSPEKKKKRLLLRDNLLLNSHTKTIINTPLSTRMSSLSVFGTLILHGPLFTSLATWFLDEFEALPRIGARNWGDGPNTLDLSPREQWRGERQTREKDAGLIWSAARVRNGFVLVKFASREVEGSRMWLRDMVREEGTVGREFGERAVLCLK